MNGGKMAAMSIEKPGVGSGPCLECKHEDCAENRELAEAPCAICNKPLGYNVRFFRDNNNDGKGLRNTHMVCRVREIEAAKVKA